MPFLFKSIVIVLLLIILLLGMFAAQASKYEGAVSRWCLTKMNEGIKNFLATTNQAHIYLPSEIIINLIISFILVVVISLVYKKTHKGLSY